MYLIIQVLHMSIYLHQHKYNLYNKHIQRYSGAFYVIDKLIGQLTDECQSKNNTWLLMHGP